MNLRITSSIAFSMALGFSISCHATEEAATGGESEQKLANVLERYSPGTINSPAVASQALEDVNRQRASVEEQFSKDEESCYDKFFVTACTDAAKDRRRKALKQLRAIEVEANAYNRRANVEQRDEALRERQVEQDAKAAEKAAPNQAVTTEAPATSKDIADIESRAAQTSPKPKADPSKHYNTERAAQHAAEQAQQREKELAEAKKREENIKSYERKQQRSLDRQREIAARKKEKEHKQERAPKSQ